MRIWMKFHPFFLLVFLDISLIPLLFFSSPFWFWILDFLLEGVSFFFLSQWCPFVLELLEFDGVSFLFFSCGFMMFWFSSVFFLSIVKVLLLTFTGDDVWFCSVIFFLFVMYFCFFWDELIWWFFFWFLLGWRWWFH